MTAELTTVWTDVFRFLVPEMILGLAACVLFFAGTFRVNRHGCAMGALVALALAGLALCITPDFPESTTALLAGSLFMDRLAFFTRVVALAGGAILVLLSWNEVPEDRAAEYHACLLIIVAGLCLTGAANELITLFVSLELISIPTYVLLYLPRHDKAAQEAAIKYFLLSVFSSAFLLFGFSYLYGLGGSTYLPAIAGAQPLVGMASVALVMIVAGLGFRITAVPFHFYAPDVYQGTSTATAALLAFVPKVAGFVALLRLLGYVLGGSTSMGVGLSEQAPNLLWIIAAVTMSLGNMLALLQDNLKRLLAYSSVAHAGYMLIGVAVAPELRSEPTGGLDAVLFYLVAYGAMTIGAFGVVAYLSTPERPVETVDDLAGLSGSHPGVALLMAVFMFSLIGIPLTAGFAGKVMLFWSAMSVPAAEQARLFRILALIGALNAAVGAWYYLRILMVMYLRTPVRPLAPARSLPGFLTLSICAALTVLFGVYPWPLVEEARAAVGRPVAVAQQAGR